MLGSGLNCPSLEPATSVSSRWTAYISGNVHPWSIANGKIRQASLHFLDRLLHKFYRTMPVASVTYTSAGTSIIDIWVIHYGTLRDRFPLMGILLLGKWEWASLHPFPNHTGSLVIFLQYNYLHYFLFLRFFIPFYVSASYSRDTVFIMFTNLCCSIRIFSILQPSFFHLPPTRTSIVFSSLSPLVLQ